MKQYLGDGVYIELESYREVILTTENGISITNTIVLESEVLKNFLNFLNLNGIKYPYNG